MKHIILRLDTMMEMIHSSKTVETYRGGFVDPGPGKQVIETKGKYVMYDIIVLEVSGLRPEVIKYGVTVGEGEGAVTGTWQGFVS